MERGLLMLVLWMSNFHFTVYSNTEILNSGESMRFLFGDALTVFRSNLSDPNDVLTSWDAQHVNPCKWVHITCNADNEVVRIDLGDANLSGQLAPQLGSLTKLQYLELYNNSISGKIPPALGNLPRLVSLDLYHNKLSGPIPDELGNLLKLRFLRLNNNSLSGSIPMSLTTISTLQLLDLSFNNLSGIIPVNGSFALFNRNSFLGNPYLNTETPSGSSPMVPARGQGATGAIAGGIASALSLSAIATALIW